MTVENSKTRPDLFSFSMWLAAVFFAGALAVYAYLGTFSRHMADDFCITAFTRTNFFVALWNNYLSISDRFSNFILIALSEAIWPRSVSILPGLMILLWVVGIMWLLNAAGRFMGSIWTKPVSLTLALATVFFVLLQAPNLYQTLYWRSSMATHFAPLVFLPYFASFLLRSISTSLRTLAPRWPYPTSFFLAFMLGGFSEPVVLVMIALLAFSILAVLTMTRPEARGAALAILTWSFMGACSALLVMMMAPANSLRLSSPPPALPELVSRSFLYTFQFIRNSFRTLPLPSLLTMATSSIMFYGLHAFPAVRLNDPQRRRVSTLMIVAPVLVYLLIVASFAPSVYGQSFPVERARFAGQFCLVIGLMIEGACLGILMAQWRAGGFRDLSMKSVATALLIVAAIYPLRAALLTTASVPEYRERAELWDLRDAYIHRHAALGERDLAVVGFSGIYGIKEWDVLGTHWVNRCAATYYRVDSIRAIPIPDEFVRKYFSE